MQSDWADKEVMSSPMSVCWLVGWTVCRITKKDTKQIATKLGWRMGLSPQTTSSTLDKGTNPAVFNIVV